MSGPAGAPDPARPLPGRRARSLVTAPTALIIESNPIAQRVMAQALEDEGMAIETAASDADPVVVAGATQPQVIVLCMGPDPSSDFTLCERFRSTSLTRHIPVVVVNALNSPADRRGAIEAGASEFVAKSESPSALTETVWRVIRSQTRILDRHALLVTRDDELSDMLIDLFETNLQLDTERRSDLDDAWTALGEYVFDVLVVDVDASPERAKVLEFIERTRASTGLRHVPLIAVTRSESLSDIEAIFESGATDYVGSPTIPDEFLARVKAHLRVKLLIDEVARLSITDSLTGIYNRRYLLIRLQEELRRAVRAKRPLACALIDVDNFKEINDRQGHLFGDRVLVEVASTLSATLRMEDIVGRYGGDEFLIVLPDVDLASAKRCAERVFDNVTSRTVDDGGRRTRVTLSVGVACFDPPSQQSMANELILSADRALYRAKEQGRARVCVSPKDAEP